MSLFKYPPRMRGFSLIEMAIVLIIISIIVGAILGAGVLEKKTQLNNLMTQIGNVNTALHAFEQTYNALAGDMYNASTVLSPVAFNGNGNGMINPTEMLAVMQHLALAGLITGSYGDGSTWNYANLMNGPFTNSKLFFTNVVGANNTNFPGIVFSRVLDLNGDGLYTTPNERYNAVMEPLDLLQLDIDYDDGLPQSGNLIAYDGINTPGGCVNTSTNPATYQQTSSDGCYFILTLTQDGI